MARLLSPTLVTPGRVSVVGFTGSDFFGDPVTAPIGQPFDALLGKVDYLESTDGKNIGEAHFTGGHPFSNQANEYVGSFLVRGTIPEPSSWLMMGWALAFLGGMRWKKRRHEP